MIISCRQSSHANDLTSYLLGNVGEITSLRPAFMQVSSLQEILMQTFE
jgi:hypothetical protein